MLVCLLLVSIVPISIFSNGEINTGDSRASDKKVIAELFTATWCTYCPYADSALHDLKAEYGDRLVILAYHPDSDDPFRNQDAVDRWNKYQNIALPQSLQWGYPTCIFDGNFSNAEVGGSDATKSAYKSQIETELQKSSLADIDGKADISGYPVVKIKATVKANTNLQSSNTVNYKLNIVIFESGINYAASNGIKVHDYVVRDVLEPEPLSLSQGSTVTIERTFDFNTSWNINNCSAAIFVQNDISTPLLKNMNVGQATDIVPFVKGASLSITPASATVLAGSSIQYSLTISNFGKLNDNYTLSKSGDASAWFSLPGLVTLSAGQSTTLTINVNVPVGASEGLKTAVISATSEKNPDVVSKTTLNITVTPIPIYNAQLTPASDTRRTISPGWANFTYTLKNTGNMPDNYTITYTSLLNWEATLNPHQVSLNPSASMQISLNIRVPSEVSRGDYLFKINVKSEKNASMNLESSANILVEEISRMVSITPKQSTVNITMGNSESITFTVSNLGNIEDTYGISLVGDIYNFGLLSKTIISLSSGMTGTFLLTISVPLTTTASSVAIKVRVVS
ncbi:MAG: Omp28-related outer membrane protein [Thermoplasmata archaeon]